MPSPGLPIPTPPPGATLARLRERLAADTAIPALDAALARSHVRGPGAELDGVVAEL